MLAESPVESGVVLITYHLSHLLQRVVFPDQAVCLHHSALCDKIVEGAVGLFLKQLGHRGYTDTAVGGNDPQREPLLQMGIHIGSDFRHHGVLSLCGTGAFLTHHLIHLFRKVLLIKLAMAKFPPFIILIIQWRIFFSSYQFFKL